MQSPHRMGGRSSSRSIEGRSGQPIGGRSVANPVEERKRLCELVARDIIVERYLGKENWKSCTYRQHGLDLRRDNPAVQRRIKKLLPSQDAMRLAYRMQQSVATACMELEYNKDPEPSSTLPAPGGGRRTWPWPWPWP